MEGHQPQVEVSVIVPCLNAASTLPLQLEALSRQTYSGTWELVVVDNGSTDATAELLREWQSRLANLRVLRATEKHNSGYARNVGMRAARGEYLLFCDADDRVEPDWIRSLAEALKVYDLVGGPMAYDALNPGIEKYLIPKPQTGLPVNAWNNRAFVPSGNRGVRRAVALAIGGSDETMTTCVDQDFSWRAADRGATLGFAPGAVVQVRLRHSLRDCWRQAFGWGVGSVELYVRHRPKAEKLAPALGIVAPGAARLVWHLPRVVNVLGRRAWICEAGLFAGRLRGLVKNRAFLFRRFRAGLT